MKIYILAQYFTVTMVVTITTCLFALKPVANQGTITSAQIVNVTQTDQELFINDQ